VLNTAEGIEALVANEGQDVVFVLTDEPPAAFGGNGPVTLGPGPVSPVLTGSEGAQQPVTLTPLSPPVPVAELTSPSGATLGLVVTLVAGSPTGGESSLPPNATVDVAAVPAAVGGADVGEGADGEEAPVQSSAPLTDPTPGAEQEYLRGLDLRLDNPPTVIAPADAAPGPTAGEEAPARLEARPGPAEGDRALRRPPEGRRAAAPPAEAAPAGRTRGDAPGTARPSAPRAAGPPAPPSRREADAGPPEREAKAAAALEAARGVGDQALWTALAAGDLAYLRPRAAWWETMGDRSISILPGAPARADAAGIEYNADVKTS
jgi:acid soluble protein 1